jgi:phosphoribosylanthranilate isomerase
MRRPARRGLKWIRPPITIAPLPTPQFDGRGEALVAFSTALAGVGAVLSMSVKIKICGITKGADATVAVEAGAHAVGFMFFKESRRYISFDGAREIIRDLPPFIAKVGVFVNAKADDVKRAIEETGIDSLQFHGEEPPEACRGFGVKTIKAFRIQGKDMLALMPRYDVDAWLLDAFVAGARGGTGVTFNWDLAVHARSLGTPIMLAGGLTPGNVKRAVEHVQPYAVDVSSGVESAPGKKDAALIAAFIENALEAEV